MAKTAIWNGVTFRMNIQPIDATKCKIGFYSDDLDKREDPVIYISAEQANNMSDANLFEMARQAVAEFYYPDLAASRQDQAMADMTDKVENLTTRLSDLVLVVGNLTAEQQDELENKYDEWAVGIDYGLGDKVGYNNINYEIIQAHTSQADWTPADTPSLFKVITNDEIEDGEVISEFKQPTGAHDAYNVGDKVIFEGKIYESLIGNNAYSPSDYPQGWSELEEVE